MGGEPSTLRGRAADLERVADALRTRFRVGEALPWGQTVTYFSGEVDAGRVLLAALPFTVAREDGSSDAFLEAAYELVELTGRGLPTVYRHGVASGVPYFAYRMPRGRTLAERMAEGPFTSRGVLRIAEGLLEALANAHRQGVVHGELIPRNVLVEERGEKVLVTLLGSGLPGLVRTLRAQGDARPSGFAPALSSYLAPELLAGGPPTVATDLYALGALLHHMVCGRAPTGFDSVEPYADLPSLVDVVRRAREHDPEARYDGAATMRGAIDWVDIESERHHAHTQDIPLWMEASVVANIPVPELLRGTSSPPSEPPTARRSEPPARRSEPPRGRPSPVPMPSGPKTASTPRASGSFSIPPAPRVPTLDEATPVTRAAPPSVDSLEVHVDLEVTPVTRPSELTTIDSGDSGEASVVGAPRGPTWWTVALVCVVFASVGGFLALFLG